MLCRYMNLQVEIFLKSRFHRSTCGHGIWSPPKFWLPPWPYFTQGGQIMPTIYWCPHQVLKATGTPVAKIFANVNDLHFSERHGKIFTKNGEHWYKTSTSKNQMRIYISHPKRFLIVDTQFYILYARFTFFMSKNWSIEAKLNNFHLSEMA